MTDPAIQRILTEDDNRLKVINSTFDPLTGEGSIGERVEFHLSDFTIPVQWIPKEMTENALIHELDEAGSITKYVKILYKRAGLQTPTPETLAEEKKKIAKRLIRIRCYYDFPFWCAYAVKIKQKGGDYGPFILNRPQRTILIPSYEEDRENHKPCRVVLDKARQWGGTTATEMYFGWKQLVRDTGLNSLIVAHVSATAAEAEDMYKNMLESYPTELLYKEGETYNENDPKWEGVGGKQNIHRVPQRRCKIKLGTSVMPENARGGDYNLVHCTEVGLFMNAEGHNPADTVQGATSGMPLTENTMIVLESTAKGVGNYFHQEYMDAKRGISQFKAVFVAWWQIDIYSMDFIDFKQRRRFADDLWRNKDNQVAPDNRHMAGNYLWNLWKMGASLEAIHWYVEERRKYGSDAPMFEEYPSTDIESFVNSGANVFDRDQIERFRSGCRTPKWKGELEGAKPLGGQGTTDGNSTERRGIGTKELLQDLHFVDDSQGGLSVWAKPEPDEDDEIVANRYLTVVDVGGRGSKADWSVILVIDRLNMLDGGKPSVVAQWYGHIDMDLLAWKAAQISKWYNDALLVIESNTLETKDRDRIVDGDQTQFILLQIKDAYDNLYARKQSEEDIKEGAPVKYGFHTNTATKPMIISTLVKIVREHAYTERDDGALDEFCFYERKQNGSYGAIVGQHDDKLMTRAIGLHVCFYDMDMPKIVKKSEKKSTSAFKINAMK